MIQLFFIYLMYRGSIFEHEVWESINDFHWGMRQSEGENVTVDANHLIAVSSQIKSLNTDADSNNNNNNNNNNNSKSDNNNNSCANVEIPSVEGNSSSSSSSMKPADQNRNLRASSPQSNKNLSRKEIRSQPTANYPKLLPDQSGISLPNLTHDLKLYSAAGFPLYTNYTKAFKDILDYIYIEKDHFTVSRVAPFPSDSILSENTALPSQIFPSDHLAVAVDIKFINLKKIS